MYEPSPVNTQRNPDNAGQSARARWSGWLEQQSAVMHQSAGTAAKAVALDPWAWILLVIAGIAILSVLPGKGGKKG